MPAPRTAPTACPCGSGASLATCCGRWHEGALRLQAPDPPTLMRSRYSAFVLDRHDYLLETWHPDTRPAALEPSPVGLRWLGLELRAHRTEGDRGEVEFVARSKLGGRAHRLHEISRFVREDGRWFYVDGTLRD